MKSNLIPLTSLVLIACTTGNNYPAQYADALCTSMFTCLEDETIDTLFQYDDIEECKEEEEESMRGSSIYDDYEEDDREFNAEAAENCLSEITEVRDDADCDGDMNVIDWGLDSSTEECGEVYED